ncbi:hypothetical protein CA13_22330 [Planctomycetes bacterium CA13]|uniref:Uncharacterized protein n=1 Tax=Novipirellula herctigrandis TaxID=2527986 RepID=A0A5C5Z1I6_9BACT|nr:hypothetical protein CA13_22330 [Planctomycetes bacterium CA13]
MRKAIFVGMLFVAAGLTGCGGSSEPTVLEPDERQSLGELMAKESAAMAELEEENPE